MTVMSSASVFPINAFPKEVDVSKEDLKSFVALGVIKRIDNHREHFAIQPCWLHDPGSGVVEEINHCTLGKWNNKLSSYVVAVQNIRNFENSAGMNEDHRWLHVDISATFYTYTPEQNQHMKGEIKKIGNKAAVCIVFDVFTATVFAKDENELKSWTVGQHIDFEITSFLHRRKGPILRAKSLNYLKGSQLDTSREEEVDEYLGEPQDGENGVNLSMDNTLDDSYSSKKSKKKKRKRELEDESIMSEGHDLYNNDQLEHEVKVKNEPESPVKKKKKKKSHKE